MTAIPVTSLNQAFIQKVATQEGREKIAATTDDFIRDRLRESAFVRQILDVEDVKPGDPGVQVSLTQDTIYKVVEVEPRTRALAMSFRGQPEINYISAPRLAVGFFKISSENIQKSEEELMAYRYPITKIFEDQSLKDLQDIEDREFCIHQEAAVQAYQAEANGGSVVALTSTAVRANSVVQYSVFKSDMALAQTVDNAVAMPIQRQDIPKLKRAILSRRLSYECMLITESDLTSIDTWTIQDLGLQLTSDTAIEGWKQNKLLGVRLVRTIKTDILRNGNVYLYTAPKFFGKMFILNQPKFWIDKKYNIISFQVWENIGMVLANIASIVKLETYSGDATTVNTNGILASVTPVPEASIGALNNRVAQGLNFPSIQLY